MSKDISFDLKGNNLFSALLYTATHSNALLAATLHLQSEILAKLNDCEKSETFEYAYTLYEEFLRDAQTDIVAKYGDIPIDISKLTSLTKRKGGSDQSSPSTPNQ